jgi:hypothetical protein
MPGAFRGTVAHQLRGYSMGLGTVKRQARYSKGFDLVLVHAI